MFYWDSTYILVIIAGIIMLIAQARISGAYAKYSKVPTLRHKTGAEVARAILNSNGLQDVKVEMSSSSQLSDHYDPKARAVRLSPKVYNESSIASVAVAAHEVGHAIQHANGYFGIKVRDAVLPLAQIGSSLGWVSIMLGIIFSNTTFLYIGVLSVGAIALFQLVTLPVEFNASSRALRILSNDNYLTEEEQPQAKAMLSAAAMTYVAGLISSLLNLLRMVLIAQRHDD